MFNFGKPASAGTSGSGGLFGQNNNTANTGSGGGFSFGQSGNNAGASNTGGGFSFGNQNQGTTSGGGLFGSKPANSGTTGTGFSFGKPAGSSTGGGGLFGGNTGNTTGSGGLFGNTNNTANTGGGGGLFGGASTNTNTSAGTGGGLFGSKPAGTSLFGNTGNTNTTGGAGGGGLFGSKPAGTSLFGNNPPNAGTGGFGTGGLFGTQQQQPAPAQAAINSISQLPITPMTRIIDLPPQLRQEIEQLDQYIQRQVQISQHLKADIDEHKELIGSVPRDIAYLLKFESQANQSLAQDLKKLTSIKEITDANLTDTQTFAIILQQLLTPGSKISSMELDKFFHHKLQSYQSKLDEFFRVLSDIESAVNGIDGDVFGSKADGFQGGASNDSLDVFAVKTGLNALVSTVVEEFQLFMDTAERIAELHQKVKGVTADRLLA